MNRENTGAPTPSGRTSSGTLHRAWPFVVAGVLSALFLAHAGAVHRTIEGATDATVRGLADPLHHSAVQAFAAEGGWPPSTATLEVFLASAGTEGLSYVGVLGDGGEVIVDAGTPVGTLTEQDEVQRIGNVARVVFRARGVERLARERRERGSTAPRRVAYEFRPAAALAVEAHAHWLFAIAGAASIAAFALAYALSRSLARRAALEAELESGRRLALLGSMSAVLAHEIRNPLASLKGNAQLLDESLRDSPGYAKAQRVVAEAIRLERLVEDLLAFARTSELRRVPCDANDVLRAAVDALAEARVEPEYAPGGIPCTLDVGRFEQVLENLLRNAVQASPPGAPVQARVLSHQGRVEFVVRDHGQGIPPGDEERIFEPFVTGRTRGVGLGLAVVRRVVELHGGTVAASNLPEGGAVFRVSVPIEEGS